MSWYITEDDNKQMNAPVNNCHTIDFLSKPIVIYNFINLTCSTCWSLEPYLKKLLLEYGMFFTVRPVIAQNTLHLIKHHSSNNNKSRINETKLNPLISVKAAGLQGNRAGSIFLRRVQEAFFVENKDIFNHDVLIECAEQAKLDIAEFKSDLNSLSSHKAFQCDKKIASEMDVNQLPTLVFFSQIIEEHTVKISGVQTYDTYVYILKKMLKKDPAPAEIPPLEQLLKHYNVVDINEIAIIYDLTVEEATLKLKELQLMQKVEQVNHNGQIFWSSI